MEIYLNKILKKLDDLQLDKNSVNFFCAMSGGVDSSCSASLIKNCNINLTGVTFNFFETQGIPVSVSDAKIVSDIIGIDHMTLNFIDDFNKIIIDPFVKNYLSGITPNPCITCNKFMKFGKALDKAIELGYTHIVTGHYANIVFDKKINRYLVKKLNSDKDQSYCFYTLSQKQLSRIFLPLFDLDKNTVRELAKKMKLPVYDKKESQDICFINTNYSDFINKYKEKNKYHEKCGDFIDEDGNFLGKHNGISNYTVGQRKKLGFSIGERAYVKKIEYYSNKIIISRGEPIKTNKLIAKDLNFIPFDKLENKIKAVAMTRYRCLETPVEISMIDNNMAEVKFETHTKFAAPGQSVVFYDNDTLIGGGIIV